MAKVSTLERNRKIILARAASYEARAAMIRATVQLHDALPIGAKVSVAGRFDGTVMNYYADDPYHIAVVADDQKIATAYGWPPPKSADGCHMVPIDIVQAIELAPVNN